MIVDFGIAAAQEELYANGVEATERFLSTWDWEEYLERFRGASAVPSAA